MLGKTKRYALNLEQITKDQFEIVGEEGASLVRFSDFLHLPPTFIVTTEAFDDFLVHNDLVNFIAPRINGVDFSNFASAKKISHEISENILNGQFSEVLSEQVEKLYKDISASGHGFVVTSISHISPQIDERNYNLNHVHKNVLGTHALEQSIKTHWASLFSAEALQYRSKIDYEGFITEAILVQKLVQAEVSGRVFSSSFRGEGEVEVQAIFGIEHQPDTDVILPDSYFVDKPRIHLAEKKIVGQDWMIVRRGRAAGENPNLKVNISSAWKHKQKLEDKHVLHLAEVAVELEKVMHAPVELTYCFESGQLFVYDVTKLIEYVEPKTTPDIKVAAPQPEKPEPVKKDINDYLKEIEEEAQKAEEQVVVKIQPINQLPRVLVGKSINNELGFGLVHIVKGDHDLKDVTGDEILVMQHLDTRYLAQINMARGLILTHEEDPDDLQQINVPLLYNVTNANNILKEGEVVTVDGEQKGVFLGAGKRVVQKQAPVVVEVEEEIEPVVTHQQNEHTKVQQVEIITPTGAISEAKVSGEIMQKIDVMAPIFYLDTTDGAVFSLSEYYKLHDTGRFADFMLNSGKRQKFMTELLGYLEPLKGVLHAKHPLIIEGFDQNLFEEDLTDLAGPLLTLELDIISELRSRDGFKTICYKIPAVKDASHLAEIRKSISSYGIRRSSTFQLAATLTTNLSALAIKDIARVGADMFVINTDKILSDLYKKVRPTELDASVINFLAWVVKIIYMSKSKPVLESSSVPEQALINSLCEDVVLDAIVLPEHINTLKKAINKAESLHSKKGKKRGRKKNVVDFGF